jgi:hypothetical protein
MAAKAERLFGSDLVAYLISGEWVINSIGGICLLEFGQSGKSAIVSYVE